MTRTAGTTTVYCLLQLVALFADQGHAIGEQNNDQVQPSAGQTAQQQPPTNPVQGGAVSTITNGVPVPGNAINRIASAMSSGQLQQTPSQQQQQQLQSPSRQNGASQQQQQLDGTLQTRPGVQYPMANGQAPVTGGQQPPNYGQIQQTVPPEVQQAIQSGVQASRPGYGGQQLQNSQTTTGYQQPLQSTKPQMGVMTQQPQQQFPMQQPNAQFPVQGQQQQYAAQLQAFPQKPVMQAQGTPPQQPQYFYQGVPPGYQQNPNPQPYPYPANSIQGFANVPTSAGRPMTKTGSGLQLLDQSNLQNPGPLSPAFNLLDPTPVAKQAIDLTSSTLGNAWDFGVGVKNGVGGTAVNFANKAVDGSEAMIKGMIGIAAAVPTAVAGLKRKTINSFASLFNLPNSNQQQQQQQQQKQQLQQLQRQQSQQLLQQQDYQQQPAGMYSQNNGRTTAGGFNPVNVPQPIIRYGSNTGNVNT